VIAVPGANHFGWSLHAGTGLVAGFVERNGEGFARGAPLLRKRGRVSRYVILGNWDIGVSAVKCT
jgi:hypothetical protein